MKPILICYDITKNNLRKKLADKIIEAGLDRINKSVYLGTISDTQLRQLETWLAHKINTEGEPNDSLIVLPSTTQQIQSMRIYGLNELDKDELTGEKTTLIL